jgi:hypothetical protein
MLDDFPSCLVAPPISSGSHELWVEIDPDFLDCDTNETVASAFVDFTQQEERTLRVLAENIWRVLAWQATNINPQNGSGNNPFTLRPQLDWTVWAVHTSDSISAGGTGYSEIVTPPNPIYATSRLFNISLSPADRRRGQFYNSNANTWANVDGWRNRVNAILPHNPLPYEIGHNPVLERFNALIDGTFTGMGGRGLFSIQRNGNPLEDPHTGLTWWDFSCNDWRKTANGEYLIQQAIDAGRITNANTLFNWNSSNLQRRYEARRAAMNFSPNTTEWGGGTFVPGGWLSTPEEVEAAVQHLFRAISSEDSALLQRGIANVDGEEMVLLHLPAVEGVGPVLREVISLTPAIRTALENELQAAITAGQNPSLYERYFVAFRSGWHNSLNVPVNAKMLNVESADARIRFTDVDIAATTGPPIPSGGGIPANITEDSIYLGTLPDTIQTGCSGIFGWGQQAQWQKS